MTRNALLIAFLALSAAPRTASAISVSFDPAAASRSKALSAYETYVSSFNPLHDKAAIICGTLGPVTLYVACNGLRQVNDAIRLAATRRSVIQAYVAGTTDCTTATFALQDVAESGPTTDSFMWLYADNEVIANNLAYNTTWAGLQDGCPSDG